MEVVDVARRAGHLLHALGTRDVVPDGAQRGGAAPLGLGPPGLLRHGQPFNTTSPVVYSAGMRICVFCGSSPGRSPAYAAAARDLGSLLARRGIGLVYGGGNVGLMGAIADAVVDAGGEAIGVIPQALVDRELAHRRLAQLHVVPGEAVPDKGGVDPDSAVEWWESMVALRGCRSDRKRHQQLPGAVE